MLRPAAWFVLGAVLGAVAGAPAQETAESLHAPPAPMTDEARALMAAPIVAPPTAPTRPEPAAMDDAQRERVAVWNSPEMRAARDWVTRRHRQAGDRGDARARRYLYELSRLDADQMRAWLERLAHQWQEESLQRQIAWEAQQRFQQVQASVSQQHQSRYGMHTALMQAAKSRSAEQHTVARRQARRQASGPGPGPDTFVVSGCDNCTPSRAAILVASGR